MTILGWNKAIAFDYDFTIAPANIHGDIAISNNSFGFGSSWDLQIGPAGFVEDDISPIQSFNGITTTIKLTTLPYFQAYDIRIRNYDQYGEPLEWSDVTAYDNCANTFFQVGYTEDFNQQSGYCWREYGWPLDTYWADVTIDVNYYQGSEGYSLSMRSEYPGTLAVLVLPKFSNLSTDKKIVFSVRGYTGSSLKLASLADPNNAADYSLIEAIPTFSNSSSEWEQVSAHLNNYNGVDSYLALIYEKTAFGPDTVQIDNFSYEQSVNCFQPQNLELSDISQTSATLNFEGMEESSWEVSIVYDIYEAQTFTTDIESFLLEDLSADTEYEIKVRAVCGPGHYSAWSEPVILQSSCDNMVSGYSTTFGFSSPDNCWSTYATDDSYLLGAIGGYNNAVSPRTGDYHVRLSNEYQTSGYGYVISPYVEDLDSNKRIEFYLTALNNNALTIFSSITVGTMTDPTDETTFTPVYTIDQEDIRMTTSPYDPTNWKKHVVYFSDYTGNDHYIAFRHDNSELDDSLSDGSRFFIDDFSYTDLPACSEPTNSKVIDFDYDFVTIGWDTFSTSTAAQWQIEYGPKGFEQGTGIFVTASSNPFNISGLQSNTEYDFYVRSICGSEVSDSTSVESFRTRCSGMSIGYYEDFENATPGLMDNCWRALTPLINSSYWTPATFIQTVSTAVPNYNGQAHSGTNSVRMFNQTMAPTTNVPEKTILVSPRLLDFNNEKNISFWMYSYASPSSDPDEIIVGTLSDPDDYTTFTPFYTITNAGEVEDDWVYYQVDFSGYNGTDEYVGIRQGEVNGTQLLYIDDFSYYQITCPTPTEVTIQQSDNTEVMVIWDDNEANVSSYEIEYGPIGFDAGTGTLLTANENPYTLEGLEEGLSYSVRVRTYCTDDTYSEWSLMYDFRLGCSETAPFYESFDEYDIPSIFINPEDFCWTISNPAASVQEQCIDGFYSCPNSISLAQNFAGTGAIVSPYFSDFDSSKRIRFHAHNPIINEDPSILIVGTIVNPLDMSTFEPYTTITLDPEAPYGKQYEVNFSDYTGNGKYVVFKHGNGISLTYISLDDVYYLSASDCPEPLNTAVQNINSNSALVVWEAPQDMDNFEIEYGVSGFTQGEGTFISATGNEQLIEGLNAQTEYEFYIRSVCNDIPSDVFVGPLTFTTTCASQPLPWQETFDSMGQYGNNILPDCFRLTEGDLISKNVAENSWGLYDGDMTSGVDDTYYLRVTNEYYTKFITPSFSLEAGTTYAFSYAGRKSYQFDYLNIKVLTGRGNTENVLTTQLGQIGSLSEYQYNTIIFYFTPIESGEYSFLFNIADSGGIDALIDDIAIQEGYMITIDSVETTATFEDGMDDFILPEATDSTNIEVVEDDIDNNVAGMYGTLYGEDWIDASGRFTVKNTQDNEDESNGIWLLNENFITKLNMKVDATDMDDLTLHFDLKQTFYTDANESQFRVVVNGNIEAGPFYPETEFDDEYVTHSIDLSAYVGGEIKISLQHLGRSIYDVAYVDNIAFEQEEVVLPCPDAFDLSVTEITTTTATLVWDAAEGTENFEIEYGPVGFTQGEGIIIEVSGTEQLIEELEAETEYEFYVKTVCETNTSETAVGPYSFTTSAPEVPCTVFSVPWLESFNELISYGNNILPSCFILEAGEAETYQNAFQVTDGGYTSNSLVTGTNDTYFLRVYNSTNASLSTPLLGLTAGTTYTFSYMARKSNNVSSLTMNAYVNAENSEYIPSHLTQNGSVTENDYNLISYTYTPLQTGNYSFTFDFEDTQGVDILLDEITVNEGYTNIVNSIEAFAGFDSGFENFIVAESSNNTTITIINEEDNSIVEFQGGQDTDEWDNTTESLWEANENFISKINFKIDASDMNELTLYFDLRQTYVNQSDESVFRVVVNGVELSSFTTQTAISDEYLNHSIDLTAFTGTDIRVSLQHLGKQQGDKAYLDNIAFQQEALSVENTIFTSLKVYPNPTKNKLVLMHSLTNIDNVKIFNLNGQELYTNHFTSNNAEIDMTIYSTGVYFVKVTIGDNEKVYKIIKE